MGRISTYINNARWIKKILVRMRRIKPPGLGGMSLLDFYFFVRDEVNLNQLQVDAASIAFNSMMAMFPAFIVLLSLLSYMPTPEVGSVIFDFFDYVLPHNAHQIFLSAIADITFAHGSFSLLSLGLLIALYFSANGIRTLMWAFQKDSPEFGERSFIKSQMIALGVTIAFILMIFITVTAVILAKYLTFRMLEYLELESWFLQFLIMAFRTLIVVGFAFICFALIYAILPATKRQWGYFTPGAIVASLSTVTVSKGFFYFAENFGSYGRLYGSIGGILVIMVWLYIVSLLMLVGFELNTFVYKHRVEEPENV